VDFITSVKTCFTKFATFEGRARRSELWWFVLFNFIVGMILSTISAGLLGMVYNLVVLLPNLAVGARRLHDTGRSGWWQLILLVPLIGLIVLIWFYATPGAKGANKYGTDPIGPDTARAV
jgi:uncharacterized membrane protein YhaH (DUF805 family)